jgi:hypothetical protein
VLDRLPAPQPASNPQPQEQPYVIKTLRRVSPEEARPGMLIRNELVISPVPRKVSKE